MGVEPRTVGEEVLSGAFVTEGTGIYEASAVGDESFAAHLTGGAYVAAILAPYIRHFFALSVPDTGMILTSVVASAAMVGALALCGFTVRTPRPGTEQ